MAWFKLIIMLNKRRPNTKAYGFIYMKDCFFKERNLIYNNKHEKVAVFTRKGVANGWEQRMCLPLLMIKHLRCVDLEGTSWLWRLASPRPWFRAELVPMGGWALLLRQSLTQSQGSHLPHPLQRHQLHSDLISSQSLGFLIPPQWELCFNTDFLDTSILTHSKV